MEKINRKFVYGHSKYSDLAREQNELIEIYNIIDDWRSYDCNSTIMEILIFRDAIGLCQDYYYVDRKQIQELLDCYFDRSNRFDDVADLNYITDEEIEEMEKAEKEEEELRRMGEY